MSEPNPPSVTGQPLGPEERRMAAELARVVRESGGSVRPAAAPIIDDERMLSMIAAIVLGQTLAQAQAAGLVDGDAEAAMWTRLADEVAEIHARGGTVDISAK